MNIKDFTFYHNLHYIKNKKEIAILFQEEFVNALMTASEKKYRIIKMTTHKWVYDHVLLDPRVTELYDIEVRINGSCKVPLEVVLLASRESVISQPNEVLTEAIRTRFKVKTVLKLKQKGE